MNHCLLILQKARRTTLRKVLWLQNCFVSSVSYPRRWSCSTKIFSMFSMKLLHLLKSLEVTQSLDLHERMTRKLNFTGRKEMPKKHRTTNGRLCMSIIGNENVPVQLKQCWFPGLAISSANIKIYCSSKLSGSNFIKQHSETVMVWNYQNVDCS